MDREVVRVILDYAKRFVDAEMIAAYLESQELIWSWNDQKSQVMLVDVFSRHLRLDITQQNQLAETFAANWDYRWNASVWATVFNGIRMLDTVLEQLDSKTVKQILYIAQRQAFSEFEKTTSGFNKAIGPRANWKSKLQANLELALKLEIETLVRMLELNEAQITKLRIAGKGSTVKLIRFYGAGDISSSEHAVHVTMEAYFDQLQMQDVWLKAIAKVLDEEQIVIWREFELVRQQSQVDSLAFMNVSTLCDGNGATSEERQALFELFCERMASHAKTDNLFTLHLRGVEATDAEIQAIVSDKLWEKMQGLLKRDRQSLTNLDPPEDAEEKKDQ